MNKGFVSPPAQTFYQMIQLPPCGEGAGTSSRDTPRQRQNMLERSHLAQEYLAPQNGG